MKILLQVLVITGILGGYFIDETNFYKSGELFFMVLYKIGGGLIFGKIDRAYIAIEKQMDAFAGIMRLMTYFCN